MFQSVMLLVIQLLPQILQSTGVISPNIESLIQDLGSSTADIITELATGGPETDRTIMTLQSLRTVLTELQTDTTLSPDALQMVKTLLESIETAFENYEDAGKVTDPSLLTPLPTDL